MVPTGFARNRAIKSGGGPGGSPPGGSSRSTSSPRRQLSSTKRRIALDRLPPRPASIADKSALTDILRRAAISHSACQNAVSRDTLVACPAIRTECLTNDALIMPTRTMASLGDFSSAWLPAIFQRRGNPRPTPSQRHPNATGCLQESGQSARISLRTGSHAGRRAGARNGSNYPLPDAVVDVIDRLVDLTAYPQVTLEHLIALQLWIYQRNVR